MNRMTESKRQGVRAGKIARMVYSSESQVKHPIRLIQLMWQDLLDSRELAWRLIIRDIKAQYRQSFLGFVWAFIPPVITALMFVLAKSNGIVNIGETNLPYPAYVMFSTALWQTFAESVTLPIQQVNAAKTMLARIRFPREALILSAEGQVLFNFGIKVILIVAVFLWFRIPITWSILLAPVALIHLIILGAAIGTFLSPLGSLSSDVTKGLTFILSFWMLLTPVVYPTPKTGIFATIVSLNPVTPLLVTTRELASTGYISDPQGFWIASMIAVIGLLFSWFFYRLAMPFVIERISS
jgi:lipopolysaccharide transport system permease protein